MKRVGLIPGLALACLGAQAQTPLVDVFGVTKNQDHAQTSATDVSYTGSRIYAFVEGDDLSPTFPAQPLTVVAPGGNIHALAFTAGRGHLFEANFDSEASLDAAFANGTYTLLSGASTYQVDLVGSYVAKPVIHFSAGRWEGGRLVLDAMQAATDWRITSSDTFANGFLSINVYDDDDDSAYQYYDYDMGTNSVSRSLTGGSLKVGHTYTVEVEFDNVVDYIDPKHGQLRNGFALFSSATQVTVSVVPEPSAWQLLGCALLAAWAVRLVAKNVRKNHFGLT